MEVHTNMGERYTNIVQKKKYRISCKLVPLQPHLCTPPFSRRGGRPERRAGLLKAQMDGRK